MSNADAIEDIYELTPMQQGMLFHSLLEPGSGMYVEQMSCDVKGDLPLPEWQAAWQRVVERHPILRSGFVWEGLEKPLQVVATEAQLQWQVEDLRGLEAAAQEARIEAFLAADRVRGFILDTAPLVRCALFRLDGSNHRFVWTYHHLLLDGWCFSIVLREVLEVVEKGVASLPPAPRPYRDYIQWLQAQDPAKAEAFWRDELLGFSEPTALPFFGHERGDPAAEAQVVRHLPAELSARLVSYAKEHRLTLNTLLQGAWALVLGRTADRDDVVFGVTVSGRPADLPGSEGIVGLFINTVPLRVRLDEAAPLLEVLGKIQTAQGAVDGFGFSSLADIQVWSEAPKDQPLFDSLLVFENYPIDRSALLERSGLEISGVRTFERTNYSLTVVAIPGDRIELLVMFDRQNYGRAAAERIGAMIEGALRAFASASPEARLQDFGIMDPTERRALVAWNQTARAFSVETLVAERVRAHAKDATAVVEADGTRLSYRELHRRAQQVAAHLGALGVGRGGLVGVAIGRSSDFVVAIYGTWLAGGAYVPLDPSYPAERLRFIVEDAQPQVIVTAGKEIAGAEGTPRLDLLNLGPTAADVPPLVNQPDDLAYVIYTSGSTGQPKGVLVSHRNLLHLIAWHTRAFELRAEDRTTQLASVAFDASVWEIWPTLVAGASLFIVPPELTAAPAALKPWLLEQGITVSFVSTPVAEALLAETWPSAARLRYLLTGGDRLHSYPPAGLPFRLVNNYGPTETTVVATSGLVPSEPTSGLPSIGRPIDNARIYILDRQLRPVPPGVLGEIYIGGEGVTRGYLNRPELTAERFVKDPFSDRPGAQIYASGDLGSFTADGSIAFYGRKDRQVQVRGIRVEPGEIEAALAALPGVSAAAVITEDGKSNGDVRLVAFVVLTSPAAPSVRELAERLAKVLPPALLPSRILPVEALPLTSNGKVDTRALIALAKRAEVRTEYVAPRTPHEEILVSIWSAVLGRQPIGTHDDFFDLGGHSLKATQVVARAREAFGVELPLRLVFEHRTIAALAASIAGGGATLEPIPAVDLSQDVPAAPGQERLWFVDALSGSSAAYNVPLVLELGGVLDLAALERAFQILVERHATLRTTFHERDGVVLQRVHAAPARLITVEEVTRAELPARIKAELEAPFALETGPLLRVCLLRLGPAEHVLVVNQHHIIADAGSLAILLRELGAAYGALSQGAAPVLAELPIRYADWAAWTRQRLEGGALDAGYAYWRQVLAGAPKTLALPSDRPRPSAPSFRGDTKAFLLPPELAARVDALARQSGASLFMTMLAAFAALLSRISGQDDLVIGAPAASRDRRETEGLIGFFLNTLALRIGLAEDPSFAELLLRVRKTALDAYAHQDVPFERLVAALGIPRDLAQNPLFQVMFTVQGESSDEMKLPGLEVRMPNIQSSSSKFDLTLVVEPRQAGLACVFEYSSDLFDEARIDRLAAWLENLLLAVVQDPELPLSEIPFLTEEQRQEQLRHTWGPKTVVPGALIAEQIAAHAARAPDRVALVGTDGVALSYGALEAQSDRLAHELVRLGVTRESIVGVAVPRSSELVVAELAVLKVGGAFLPLDPGYPSDRLSYITSNAKPRVIVCAGADPIADRSIVRLDLSTLFWDAGPRFRPSTPVRPDDLAYVIYTSGSTGAPKGVMVTHRNLQNLVAWHNETFRLGPQDRATQIASVAFDATVWEIWPSLAAGATLYVVPPEVATLPAALTEWLVKSGITLCFLPTPLAEAVLSAPWPAGGALRVMHVAGDRLHLYPPPGLPFAVVNDYGPTETTVCATSGVVPSAGAGLPSIGRPLGNARVYILDAALRMVPPGSVGEICIGGAGVAKGYLYRDDLTAERFVPDPYSDLPGARLYRSGDLGSLNPDGTIAFLGRRDRQVKVRGVRIEPAEIESALGLHPALSGAAVVPIEQQGETQLIGFVVPRPGSAPVTSVELSRWLGERLPAAMVPGRLVSVEALPLTPNGKVDYAALQAEAPREGGAEHVAPRTPAEKVLAEIWSAVLGRPVVGVLDDFFELGGHSLKAAQVSSRARQALGRELPVRLIFEKRCIQALAAAIGEASPELAPIPRRDGESELPLAPGQESLWFIDQLGGADAAYNVPLVLELHGALDESRLRTVLERLVERHEALRTTFHARGDAPVQRIGPRPAEVLTVEHLPKVALAERLHAELAAPFSLAEGPLFRARLFWVGEREAVLVLNQHHIITDAWSIGVLLRELITAYSTLAAGQEPALPPLSLRYADWAAWQHQRWVDGEMQASLQHFTQALAGAPELLSLPADRPRPERQSFRGKSLAFELPAPIGTRLEALAQSTGASLFMALLGAFAAYVSRISGQDDLVIGSPAANRDRPETEGLLGYFLNTLAYRFDLTGDPSFRQLLGRVRTTALEAYAHQDLPFEKLVAALGIPRSLQHNPLFQVMFTIQGQSAGQIALPGVEVHLPKMESPTSKFDLTLFAEPKAGGLACLFEYSTDLFDDARIARQAAHLGLLLEGIVAQPDVPLSRLSFLSAEEERQISSLNQTTRDYRAETLGDLFAAQLRLHPEAIALEHGAERLSYQALDEQAEALADRLASMGVGPDVLVAICLERSIPALVSVLAVLKAGGAYVPLDPGYPKDRLRFMLEDSAARVLITDASHRALTEECQVQRILLGGPLPSFTPVPRRTPTAESLAYVIYTSGSTGKPKGVAMPHGPLVNLIHWQKEQGAPLRTLQFAPLSFDVSFQETFSAWGSGATLVLVDEATRRDPDALVELLSAAGIERLFLPAVALHHLAQAALRKKELLPALVEVITAGDQLRVTEPIRRWFGASNKRLHNHYGPTESHVVTALAIEGEAASWPGLPSIGRPIANSEVLILDGHRQLLPPGIPGELYLAGACLARGYLGRPELTAERFVELEIGSRRLRAYKTGDLAQLSADGTVAFLGRADDQVKIRGFRVEPGEIERALCAHPAVADAAVVVDDRDPSNKRLVAYVVAEPETIASLPAFLGADLPEYMVPALFLSLPALPRTPSGKVDRRGLPRPDAPTRAPVDRGPERPTQARVRRAFEEVLGRQDLGPEDDFFRLGGHSLLAMQVISRLREGVDAELRVALLFENPTIQRLAAALERMEGEAAPLTLQKIEPAPAGAAIPLSFSQERLWFLDQLHQGSAAYNLPIALRLSGALDVPALSASLSEILARHTVLNMRFVERDGRVWQEPGVPAPLELVELGPVSPEELRRQVVTEAARPFDLANGPLFRARLFRLAKDEHVVVSTMHHTVGDGWSISVLVKELSALYVARAAGKSLVLPPLTINYLDFAYRQRQLLSGAVLERRLEHWKQVLSGAPEALNLPGDRPRPPKPSLRGATEKVALGRPLSEAVERLARDSGATSFMVLLAAYTAMLSRISGQDDIVIGTPVANRDRPELEPLIGFFVGTLPIRVDLSGDPSFAELLGRVRAAALDAFQHQDIPLEKIVDAVQPERQLSHAPLFQAMLVLQNTPSGRLALPGLTIEPIDLEIGISKSDLALILEPTPEGLRGAFEYSTDLFDADRIARLVDQLGTLLGDALAKPKARLSELALVPEVERAALARFARGRAVPLSAPLPMHQIFERHAAERPEAIALVLAGQSLSYGALDARANQIAQALIGRGARPGQLIGLCVPRSFDLIAGILGIWKAGAAYLPLDPSYPRARLDDILVDSGARLVLSSNAVAPRWTATGAETLWVEDVDVGSPAARPAVIVGLGDPAYVIYTSGSTGRPKGVLLEHRGLANVVEIHRGDLGVDAQAIVLQFASISFDASVWEIVMAIGSGGRLVLVPADTLLAGEELADVLIENAVSHAALPPTSLAVLPEDRAYSSLRLLISAGEACPPELVKRWAKAPIRFVNGYGPTESTICTTLGTCDPAHSGAPPIGRPATNLEVQILDARGKLLPIGVPGELHIGGLGLARGYLGRPELTAQKFIEHPLEPGARLYRSGDLARWRADGSLDYLGRIDDQVKLRGFRIELGEIEAVLALHPAVAQALVVVHSGPGGKSLVGYVVKSGALEPEELRRHAKAGLPEFMVPQEIVILPAFPLTSNGKIDKKRLPAPTLAEQQRPVFQAPRTPIELALAEIWAGLLNRPLIGLEDDFFALGGHSLLAAQVMSRVKKTLGVDVGLSAIFEHPTLGALAEVISSQKGAADLPPITRRAGAGDRPLSFSQERLRFLSELEGESAAYNIPVALRLKGKLSRRALEESLSTVLLRHEALRTYFPMEAGGPVARLGAAELPLLVERLPAEAVEARIRQESARPFSLATGPLLRALLIEIAGSDEYVLVVVMHHIVSDGWSIGVLMRELSTAYAAHSEGRAPILPELPIQYGDYAEWQRAWLEGSARDRQLEYFVKALAGAPTILELPSDRPRPAVRSHRGGAVKVEIPQATALALAALGRTQGATLYMSLLSAFGAYLGRISSQDDLIIGSPFAGRRLAETEGLIGFFVNTLPLRVELTGDPSFTELLARVRRQALGAHEHQDLPFERLVMALEPERVLGTSPIFQVMFALQQTHAGGMGLAGLEVEPISAESGRAKFDLSLSLAEGSEGIGGALEYDADLFDAWRIEAMVQQFMRFLTSAVAAPAEQLSNLDYLDASERARLLPRPDVSAETGPTVLDAIRAAAGRSPGAIAVESAEGTITYAELLLRAGRVAAELRAHGVEPETLVGIALPRSIDLMVAVLGTLQAGAAYVPLDPAYPAERLAFMLKDSGAQVVVTTAEHAGLFPGATLLHLSNTTGEGLTAVAGSLAYCLYTSGSTGQPKGVLIEHRALMNHMKWMAEAMPLTAADRVLQRTSLSFDASVWELFLPLMVGARLVMAPQDLGADTERLVKLLREQEITVLQLVPSLLGMLVEEPGFEALPKLRRVCAGGEALPSGIAEKVLTRSRAELWNLYGPTEATIDATAHRCRPEELGAAGASEPIGLPITGMQALVLDRKLRPVPDGVPGELYLAGPCLARGYLHRPELTASRFIVHTFPGGPTLRMYKTGDLVRRAKGGVLVFLGRVDRQVKLRGFRIELGEVEAAIARYSGVREVAALIRGAGPSAQLIAYVDSASPTPDSGELRRFLEQSLAAHMVPSQLVFLEALPHAPNGKVDILALAARELPAPGRARVVAQPRDGLELELVRLFEEVLAVKDVGILDNFFELGGHSLLALKLKLAVEKSLSLPLALVALFQHPTPEALADLLRRGASGGQASPLIPLTAVARQPGAARPFFLVPGGGSTPFYLMALAKELSGLPVYGLQPRGLDGEAPAHETVESEAAWYLEAIRAVQPVGPYFVGGHSIGGHVAYEIARQLAKAGQEIGLVALLDTVAPFPEATRPMGTGWDTAQWLAQIAGVMEGFFEAKVELDLAALRAMNEEDRLAAFVGRMQATGILPAGAGPAHVRGILNVARAQDGTAYAPPCDQALPLMLFRAEEKSDPNHPTVGPLIADPALGWSRFSGREVPVYMVPGSHLTLVREPNVHILGAQLRAILGLS